MKLFNLPKEDKKIIITVILIAIVIRLLFVIENLGNPFIFHLFSDSKVFENAVAKIVNEGLFALNNVFVVSPFYTIFLYIIKVLLGNNLFIIFLIQTVINTLTLFLIYFAARNLFNKQVAIISLIVSTLFDGYIFTCGLVVPSVFEIFFFAVLIYLISDFNFGLSKKGFLFIGLTLGFISIIRTDGIIILISFIIFQLLSKKIKYDKNSSKSFVIRNAVFGFCIVLLPITLINFANGGEFTLSNSGDGVKFYLNNNDESTGVFFTPMNFDYENDPSAKELASNLTNKKLTEGEASSYWYGKAVSSIFNNTTKFLALSLSKLFLFFDSDPFPEATIYNMDFYKENFTSSLKLPLINFGFISFIFIVGFFLYIKESEKNNFLVILFVTFLIITLFSSINLRNKIGITPLMIIIGSFGIIKMITIIKENNLQKIAYPFIVAFIIFIVNTFFISKPKVTEFDGYLNLGNFYQEQKRYDEAIYNYNRSIMLKDEYVTFLNLGKTFAKKSDYTNSLSAFNEAEKRNANDYMLYYNKGFVYSQMGNYDKSLEAFYKAIKLNPEYAPTYRNIGIIFYVAEKFPEAKRYFQKFLSISNDEQTNELVRQDLKNIDLKSKGN